ncbi:MAG: pirin family protein [Synechococcales bacterium]|nr:pirin family protein [Synechococcales bacterium]
MLTIRKANDRGYAHHGWLESYHTFSFANYYHPAHMGYRSLRVINEDRIAEGAGFGTHPHRDMEIISYVLAGALEHRDSMGNGSIIRPGDVQRMTAGTGVTHSEFNPSDQETAHLLQIWILPDQTDLTPSYEGKHFPATEKRGQLRLLASQDGREDSVRVHQDMNLYATLLQAGERLTHPASPDRYFWVQMARGEAIVNGEPLTTGDAIALEAIDQIELTAQADAEILLFDLA